MMDTESRIEWLERQVRRQRRLLVLAGLVVLGVALTGMRGGDDKVAEFDRIRARMIETEVISVHETGKGFVRIFTDGLHVCDDREMDRAGLLLPHGGREDGGGPVFYLLSRDLTQGVHIDEHGVVCLMGGEVSVLNRQGKTVCSMAIMEDGTGRVGAYSNDGSGQELKGIP